MLTDIEEIVVNELGGLCGSCVHYQGCAYRMYTNKVVIQCEVFESSGGTSIKGADGVVTKGLCVNCTKRLECHLPKEASGVWHCEEYE